VVTHTDQIFDALGDPTRRAVLSRLRAGPLAVGEIADGMRVSRSAVSQHLKVLKTARLVTDEAVGTRRLYALDTRGIEAAREWLDGFWDRALAAFKQAAEDESMKEEQG
jgi:DNA-binding transcriptional ArsR family regulator